MAKGHMVSPRKSRSSVNTEDDYFHSTMPGSANSPTPERQSPPPPNLIASPPSSSDEASFRNHGWASPVASRPRRRCSLSSCAEGSASPQRLCGSLNSCAKAISCDTICVEVGGGAGCCSSPNQNRRPRRKRGRRSAGRRGSGAFGACIGGDCSEGGGTCITIHLPPTSVLQSRIGKAASFLLFVYLLCLMRWVVDSQKHSLRMAREVEESLRMETDLAREAKQTLKDLELEFQEELRLAAASASVTAGRSAMDGMGDGDLRADISTYGPDMSTATTSIDARPGEDSVHGRLRR